MMLNPNNQLFGNPHLISSFNKVPLGPVNMPPFMGIPTGVNMIHPASSINVPPPSQPSPHQLINSNLLSPIPSPSGMVPKWDINIPPPGINFNQHNIMGNQNLINSQIKLPNMPGIIPNMPNSLNISGP